MNLKLSMEEETLAAKAVIMSRDFPYLFRIMTPVEKGKPVMVMEYAWYMDFRRRGYVTVAQIKDGVRLPAERWEKERIA